MESEPINRCHRGLINNLAGIVSRDLPECFWVIGIHVLDDSGSSFR